MQKQSKYKILKSIKNNVISKECMFALGAGYVWGLAYSIDYSKMSFPLSYNVDITPSMVAFALGCTAFGAGMGYCCSVYQKYKETKRNEQIVKE